LANIVHDVEVERGLEGFEIGHVFQPFLYLFEAGEVLVERQDKAGGVMVKALGDEVLVGAHGVDMLIELLEDRLAVGFSVHLNGAKQRGAPPLNAEYAVRLNGQPIKGGAVV